MSFLQGSTYKLPVKIRDCGGNVVTDETVERASFTFDSIVKEYGVDGGDVVFDWESESWIVPLTEEETFALEKSVKWQARFLFKNGEVDGTEPKNQLVYDSIDKTRFTGGEEDA